MLGHELRNPLAPILTALEIMKMRAVQGVSKEREVIERQVKHLVGLVDDLLDVSRIAQGKLTLRREPTEMFDVVSRALEQASPLLEQSRHRLSLDVPRAGLVVHADCRRLSQVVTNLLTNAAKYTEPGGLIQVSARCEGGEVVVRVDDSGIGIEPEILPRIFESFFQTPQGIERSAGGLGLGLAIVSSFVTLHGGSVTAASPGRGKGATFEVKLPVLAPSATPQAHPDEHAAPSRPSLRILVVDDNPDAAESLASLLELRGHIVQTAGDGPSALRAAGSFRPEVALLDLGLPVMDGYELAARLREMPPLANTQLVAVTGYGQADDRQQTREAGFSAHLVKPVSLEMVEEALAASLQEDRTTRAAT